MEAPAQIQPNRLGDYLATMTKAVFQSGMSWKVVESKWPDICEALDDFDPEIISQYGEAEIDQLAQDKRVIRNRRKLESIVHNARRMVELDEQHGGFRNYLRSHDNFDTTLKDIRKQFKFMGDMGTYYFLYVVGENVPDYHEFCERSHR